MQDDHPLELHTRPSEKGCPGLGWEKDGVSLRDFAGGRAAEFFVFFFTIPALHASLWDGG